MGNLQGILAGVWGPPRVPRRPPCLDPAPPKDNSSPGQFWAAFEGAALRARAASGAAHLTPSHDSLAEWSKALASGASPKGRGFEPHSCHALYSAPPL